MASLVCDVCGGKLVMGQGGIAICDSCGIEHSPDRVKEKIQEIKGTVRVDNSHMIDGYLEIANNALDARNLDEAERYANKIIEIDSSNYSAWMIKGKAAGWQSTLQNSRVIESINAFSKALSNAPEELKAGLVEEAKTEIIDISGALVRLRADLFAKFPNEDVTNDLCSDIDSIYSNIISFIEKSGVVISSSEMMRDIAKTINSAVVTAYQEVILPDYKERCVDERPGKYEWETYIDRISFCTLLVNQAILLCDDDDNEDIVRYENLIFLEKEAIKSCSWEWYINDWGDRRWRKEWFLSEEAKTIRKNLIAEYEQKIEAIKSEIELKEKEAQEEQKKQEEEKKKRRYEEYWHQHTSERNSLEHELEDINGQIEYYNQNIVEQTAVYRQALEEIPGKTEIANWNDYIANLESEKKSLGIFKGKEKKILQEKIDDAMIQRNAIQATIDVAQKELDQQMEGVKAETIARVSRLSKRKEEILAELNMER